MSTVTFSAHRYFSTATVSFNGSKRIKQLAFSPISLSTPQTESISVRSGQVAVEWGPVELLSCPGSKRAKVLGLIEDAATDWNRKKPPARAKYGKRKITGSLFVAQQLAGKLNDGTTVQTATKWVDEYVQKQMQRGEHPLALCFEPESSGLWKHAVVSRHYRGNRR